MIAKPASRASAETVIPATAPFDTGAFANRGAEVGLSATALLFAVTIVLLLLIGNGIVNPDDELMPVDLDPFVDVDFELPVDVTIVLLPVVAVCAPVTVAVPAVTFPPRGPALTNPTSDKNACLAAGFGLSCIPTKSVIGHAASETHGLLLQHPIKGGAPLSKVHV
jgi:hypothetical protein